MSFAEKLSLEQRKKHQRQAVAACCFGCVADQVVDTNAILILYLTMLGGSPSISMFSTVLTCLAFFILLIPFSGLSSRFGQKLAAKWSCAIACASFLIMAAAPFFFSHGTATNIVLVCVFFFGLTRPLYLATWYPLLDNFLLPEERAEYFGRMRFIYMILIAILIFTVGQFMTRGSSRPPLWVLQITLAFTGLCQIGRGWFMNQFPEDTERKPKKVHMTSALAISVRNGPLVGFSLYQCFLNIAVTSVIPVMFIYMNKLRMSGEAMLTVTAAGMVGSILGYKMVGPLIHRYGTKPVMILTHFLYLLVSAALFFYSDLRSTMLFFIVNLTFGFAYGLQNVICSSEMMALARPGNKSMAMAFCNTFAFFGTAAGRFGTTVAIALALFSEQWSFLSISCASYHAFQLSFTVLILFSAMLLLVVPAVVPKHHDYYHP